MSVDWSEKRSNDRWDLESGGVLRMNVQVPLDGGQARILPSTVQNVSMRGCRLRFSSPHDRSALHAAQVVIAALELDGRVIPLKVEVVRLIGADEAAVRFKAPFPRELEKLERFLEPRNLGRSLREIDPSALQTAHGDGRTLRWFQGLNETSLFSWTAASGATVQQQLVFVDTVVEWSAEGTLKTGRVKADQRTGAVGWVAADVLEFDATADASALAQAQILMESSRIDAVVRDAFLQRLKDKKGS